MHGPPTVQRGISLAIAAAIGLAALAAKAGRAQDGDWPQWRGAAHDGHAPGERLADSFPPAGPPVLWAREIGQGYSGFAVSGGRVYTQSQSLYEQSVLCLDAETGRTIWSYSYGWPYDGGGLYPGPRSTPTVSGGQIYFASPQGLVGCLTTAGRLVWSVNINELFGGRGTDFGYSCSPLVVDGLVILPVGGERASVVALSTADGATVWKAGSNPASYSTPVPIEWRGQPLVVALLQNSLACIHRRTGELWWELPLSQGYDEHATALIYREPYLLKTGPFHSGATLLELKPDGERCQPQEVWFNEKLSNDVASSVLAGETIFGFDLREAQSRLNRPSRGEFRALDFLTGQIRWSSAEPGHAQIVAADGKLILFNDRGELILARASSERYEELGRAAVFPGEVCWTAPALANGRLYLRTPSRAVCLYLGREPLAMSSPLSVLDAAGGARFNPGVLLGGERDYPATLPQTTDFGRWYAWCSAALLCCLLASGVCLWLAPKKRAWIDAAFWTAILLCGLAGSAVLNRVQPLYVFTWPLALWAAFQLTISRSWSVRNSPLVSWRRGSSYAVGLAFLGLGGLYFHLCRRLGLAIEWGFLAGFLGALPFSVLAAALAGAERRKWLLEASALFASFAAYYWSCVLFLWWRLGP
ncbi:MAG TPA: PQQ-binding-like beta-propeller repeat protein [Pirellulaceae bacterium]|nr:PQQ-binding-like beta-propeller repeat protein [Pirellulaceae bacterium]